MVDASVDDLVRLIRDYDGSALHRLLAANPSPATSFLADLVGFEPIPAFIFAHLDQFRGSTAREFLDWLSSFTEEQLREYVLARLKAADSQIWNAWLTKHRDRLRRWTETAVGVSPGHGGDVSDVVQIACIDVFQNVPASIATYEQFLAWVRTSLRRRAIDLSRKRVLHVLGGQTSGSGAVSHDALEGAIVAANTTVCRRAQISEREECLVRAANELEDSIPNDALLVMQLRQVDGFLLKEVARGIERSPVETARLYYDGLRYVRSALDQLEVLTEAEERSTRLVRALRGLPEKQRQAVELKHVENYTLWEIAQVLGYVPGVDAAYSADERRRKEQAVGSLLARAMTSLRAAVE